MPYSFPVAAIINEHEFTGLKLWSPTFLAPRTVLWKTVFPQTGSGGDGFRMIGARNIYYALCFCYYYIVIYNEVDFPRGSDGKESACNAGDRG